MEITEVRLKKIEGNTRLKAFVSITIDNAFVVHELRVIQGDEQLFVAMPSYRVSGNIFRDYAHPISADARKIIEDAVLAKYFEQA